MSDEREAARNLVQQLVDAYNAKDLEGIVALYTEDARYWSAFGDWAEGREAVRSHLADLFATLPDERMQITTIATDGVVAAVEFASTGTTRAGDAYRIEFTEVIELRAGRIASVRVYLDPEDVAQIV